MWSTEGCKAVARLKDTEAVVTVLVWEHCAASVVQYILPRPCCRFHFMAAEDPTMSVTPTPACNCRKMTVINLEPAGGSPIRTTSRAQFCTLWHAQSKSRLVFTLRVRVRVTGSVTHPNHSTTNSTVTSPMKSSLCSQIYVLSCFGFWVCMFIDTSVLGTRRGTSPQTLRFCLAFRLAKPCVSIPLVGINKAFFDGPLASKASSYFEEFGNINQVRRAIVRDGMYASDFDDQDHKIPLHGG